MSVEVLGIPGAERALAKYLPAPMEKAARKATMAGAKVAAKAIRPATPKVSGNLRRSVRARRGRRGYAAALAGPGAPHRHLVIRGHRIVTPGGRYTGRRTQPNPFVDRAVAGAMPAIVAAVQKEMYRA